ncbi:MAG TPA: DUF736 domain-containing protein [Rhizomicrobium sp.]|nr:DUF736 domain-containing protein [Rhizomicrobium sp.]
MIIGSFTEEGDGSYRGSISCFGLYVEDVTLAAVMPKRGDGPDFVVFSHDAADSQVEIGGAWNRVSEKKGRAYLSLKLDGPTLAAPINCALTRQPDGSYALLWNRPKAKLPEDQGDEAAT